MKKKNNTRSAGITYSEDGLPKSGNSGKKRTHFKFPEDRKKKDTAKMWSVYLIDFILNEGYERWKNRCDKVHEKVKRNETEQARQTINSKVSALYTVAMDVGYRDRYHIFSKTLEDKLKESIYQLQRWVAINSPAVKQAAHDFKRCTKAKTKDIGKYFGAPTTPIVACQF